jgi:hypothetical protein
MNVLKISKLIVAGLCVGLAGAAAAADVDLLEPAPAASGLTRAEVIADLQVWRESGLANLEHGDGAPFTSLQYEQARARYAQLRAAPRFAALVEQIAHARGESVQMVRR